MSFFNTSVGPVLFPSILWRTSEQSIHLTFDDGPLPTATPQVLDFLREEQIKATFFLLGRNVEQYPTLARQIVNDGHHVGNHTYDHPIMFFRSAEFQRYQIHRTTEIMQDTLGVGSCIFRPPYGYFDFDTLRLAAAENQRVVLWDVDARDFLIKRHDQVTRRVSRRVRQGSVILLHDNEITAGSILDYLRPLVGELRHRGFRFSSLPL